MIRAAVLDGPGKPLRLAELAISDPAPGEVLVDIVATGVCHTDLLVQGAPDLPHPMVLGHEGAGVVRAVGAGVTKVSPGDHVVLTFLSCGECGNCHSGQMTYCDRIEQLNFSGQREAGGPYLHDGQGNTVSGSFFGQSSFATQALASQRNVVKVDKDIDLSLLGPLGCGIQTGAGAVINTLKPHPGATIAVYGAGAVGLSAIMAAKAIGVTRIIAIDLVPERLELARELGASDCIQSTRDSDLVALVHEILPGGSDFAVETTAVPQVLRQAVDALGIPGTCVFLGAAPPGTEVSLDMASLMIGKTVKGVVEGDSIPDVFIPYLINLYQAGRFPFDRLIRHYPFDQINAAIADMEGGKTVKPVLTM